ncbi:WXG100 family type VII secretion target [Actinomadura rayongensis]|uniref:Uncharacterized protein n=1 Tax=Actinomadura rayongensis TaxID=1429076 RepID=A0A6I4W3T3_9ACTN|nr:WXG100 family type VII secretion target [Actinomadura rayongensis]MXQ64827.1 hypothetical protein [Actinomadura rayongensis]
MTRYTLRTGGAPTGDPSSYGDIGKIRALLDATDHNAISNAGAAYVGASQHLIALREVINRASKALADDWEDEAATATQKALRKLHTTADQLAAATEQMGKTLDWYGDEILRWYVKHKPDTGLIKDGGDDKYAREYMQRLNARIAQAWSRLPEAVTVERLKQGIEQIDDPSTRPMTSGAPASSPTAAGGSPGGSPGAGHHPLANATGLSGADGPLNGGANGHPATGVRPGALDGAVTGTDLAGAGGNGITGSPFGGPPTGPGGAPSPFGGVGPGGPPGALPGAGADPGGLGPLGGRPGGLGNDGFGPNGRGGTASSAKGSGPLGPGAAGAGKREDRQDERRREFWLAEERENWNADPAVSPVIGGASPASVEYDDEAWRADSSTANWGVEPVPEVVLGSPVRPEPAQAEPADESDDAGQAKDARPERLEAPPELRGSE